MKLTSLSWVTGEQQQWEFGLQSIQWAFCISDSQGLSAAFHIMDALCFLPVGFSAVSSSCSFSAFFVISGSATGPFIAGIPQAPVQSFFPFSALSGRSQPIPRLWLPPPHIDALCAIHSPLLTSCFHNMFRTVFNFFKDFFFNVDHLKNLYWICYNIASVLCFVFLPQGMWDLSPPTRDWTWTPCLGRWTLNHWTTREVP